MRPSGLHPARLQRNLNINEMQNVQTSEPLPSHNLATWGCQPDEKKNVYSPGQDTVLSHIVRSEDADVQQS